MDSIDKQVWLERYGVLVIQDVNHEGNDAVIVYYTTRYEKRRWTKQGYHLDEAINRMYNNVKECLFTLCDQTSRHNVVNNVVNHASI